jgi:NADPH:quinone reductase-like Zn-dependent oxidoreductase
MQAIVVNGTGTPEETLKLVTDYPKPARGPGQVG